MRSSITVSGAGNAPARSRIARSLADWTEKLPEICPEPPVIGSRITGAEITLRRDLPELARLARGNGFEHVRIQTHGMRLADLAYCRELIDAGVDEFFVSVAASDADSHDAITGVPAPGVDEITSPVSMASLPGPLPALRLPVDLPRLLRETEEAYIRLALDQTGGNKKEAARLLGMGRTTLVEKLRRKAAVALEKSAEEI